MKIEIEMTVEEMKSSFVLDEFDFNKPFEVKIGNEVFVCRMHHYQSASIGDGWSIIAPSYTILAQGSSKRLQDIAEAKALVNKTKEAHKEAQRKLAELQEV